MALMQKKSVDLATVLVYLGVKLKVLTVIMTIHIFRFKIKVIFVRYINRFEGFCINSPLSILSCYSTQITPDFNTFLTNVCFPLLESTTLSIKKVCPYVIPSQAFRSLTSRIHYTLPPSQKILDSSIIIIFEIYLL